MCEGPQAKLDADCFVRVQVSASQPAAMQPFGIDPALNMASALYSARVRGNEGTFYNVSSGSSELSPATRYPWGFFPRSATGVPAGFAVPIPADIDAVTAFNFWRYLRDGYFIDGMSAAVRVHMAVYNSASKTYVLWRLLVTKRQAGSFHARSTFRVLPHIAGMSSRSRGMRAASALRHLLVGRSAPQLLLVTLMLAHGVLVARWLIWRKSWGKLDAPHSFLAFTAVVGAAAALVSLLVATDAAGALISARSMHHVAALALFAVSARDPLLLHC